jgi:hypothetical protein
MHDAIPASLTLARRVLRILIKLNLLMGVFISTLFIASLIAGEWVMRALGAQPDPTLHMGMRAIMVIGICSVPLVNVALTRVLAIVDSVSVGNAFVPENAARLQTIAWSVLLLEVLHLVVGAITKGVSSPSHPLDINWSFSVTPWLAVLLLFVLARVFEQGARMRDDLEGTV